LVGAAVQSSKAHEQTNGALVNTVSYSTHPALFVAEPLRGMTRAYVIFRNQHGDIVLVVFVKHDGYPEALGLRLAQLLYLTSAHNFGCLAAQVGAVLAVDTVDGQDDEDDTADEDTVDGQDDEDDAEDEVFPVEYNHLSCPAMVDPDGVNFIYTVQQQTGEDAQSTTTVRDCTQGAIHANNQTSARACTKLGNSNAGPGDTTAALSPAALIEHIRQIGNPEVMYGTTRLSSETVSQTQRDILLSESLGGAPCRSGGNCGAASPSCSSLSAISGPCTATIRGKRRC